jgi:protocatechuate 3,4-dioxygenase beta subunit
MKMRIEKTIWLCVLLISALSGRALAQNAFTRYIGRALAGPLAYQDAGKSQPADGRLGQITGTLVDFDGKPVPGAALALKRLGVPLTIDGPQTITDERGKFTFGALLPGAYSFAFPPDTDDYGEPKVYRPGDTVTLRSAWMGKGCVITGLVTNSSGEPVIEAPVHAIRIRNSEGAAERPAFDWRDFESGGLTDDRGIYRIWGIAPGSFLVSAGGKAFQNWGPPGPYDEDAPTYYASASLADAKVVQVVNGQEAAGIDIKYIGDTGHRITGAVRGFNHADGQNGGVMISLTQASTGRVQAFISVRGSEESPTYAIASVPDGEYCVSGLQVWNNDLKASSACHTVKVKGADVTGADIVMATGIDFWDPFNRTDECNQQRW